MNNKRALSKTSTSSIDGFLETTKKYANNRCSKLYNIENEENLSDYDENNNTFESIALINKFPADQFVYSQSDEKITKKNNQVDEEDDDDNKCGGKDDDINRDDQDVDHDSQINDQDSQGENKNEKKTKRSRGRKRGSINKHI